MHNLLRMRNTAVLFSWFLEQMRKEVVCPLLLSSHEFKRIETDPAWINKSFSKAVCPVLMFICQGLISFTSRISLLKQNKKNKHFVVWLKICGTSKKVKSFPGVVVGKTKEGLLMFIIEVDQKWFQY